MTEKYVSGRINEKQFLETLLIEPRNRLQSRAEIADDSGIDLVTIKDHPYLNHFLDTWTLLTALAMRTRRLRFMTNVANIPLRHPPILAKSAATIEILARGRIELGIDTGTFSKAIAQYGGLIRSPGGALRAIEEAIQVIRAIWDSVRAIDVRASSSRGLSTMSILLR